jgi:hypothetical protein
MQSTLPGYVPNVALARPRRFGDQGNSWELLQ